MKNRFLLPRSIAAAGALLLASNLLTGCLGTHQDRHHGLLSLLMFQPEYLSRLIALGEADTDARPEIAAFLRGE